MRSRTTGVALVIATATATLIALAACSGTRGRPTSAPGATSTTAASATTTTVPASAVVLLAVHDGEVEAIAPNPPFVRQVVVPWIAQSGDGVDANGVLCRDPSDPHRLALGERGVGHGVAIVDVSGAGLGALRARVRSRHPTTTTDATVTGCAFLDNGRLAVAEDHAAPGDDRIVIWPATGSASPCALDVRVEDPGPMVATTTAEDEATDLTVAVGRAPELAEGPTVVAMTIGPGSCVAHDTRGVAPATLSMASTPSALTTLNHRLWLATTNDELVAIADDSVVDRRTTPAGVTVDGIAADTDGTWYMTTSGRDNRSGVLWRSSGASTRVLASDWSGVGSLLLYAAPDR